ncbi:hypothetical protein JCM8208_004400 [Rhodotorula glutinis]
MANAKSTKPTSNKRKSKPEKDTDHFAAWRQFYALESKKVLEKSPGLKQRTVQKRVSAAYRRHKEELASREGGGESGEGSGEGEEK